MHYWYFSQIYQDSKKKEKKKKKRHRSIFYLLGLREPVSLCKDLDTDADSESQWCTHTAK